MWCVCKLCLPRRGERIRGLGLGYTHPVETGGVGCVSVLRWCGCGGLGPGSVRVVLCLCESGFFV